jgi:hypothetical protein
MNYIESSKNKGYKVLKLGFRCDKEDIKIKFNICVDAKLFNKI